MILIIRASDWPILDRNDFRTSEALSDMISQHGVTCLVFNVCPSEQSTTPAPPPDPGPTLPHPQTPPLSPEHSQLPGPSSDTASTSSPLIPHSDEDSCDEPEILGEGTGFQVCRIHCRTISRNI